MYCDLHTHSTASDGTVPPGEVVRRAREARLVAMALTDHDTFAGVEEALEAGRRLGVRVVPGIELSLPHAGTFHMIGLGVDPGDARLRAVADMLREGRGPRNAAIAEQLRALGIDVHLEEVEAEAGGEVVARPHFARVLLRKGVVASYAEAFERYLAKGAPAYADRPRVELPEAIAAIRGAGGASVLCHPYTLGFRERESASGRAALVAELRALAAAGLDAMEVRYGAWRRADERFYEQVAEEAGLRPSGGSDFHGGNRPDLRVGSGRGRLRVPVAWLDALLAR